MKNQNNTETVKGIFYLIIGILLIGLAWRIIINVLSFVAGIFLVYLGLLTLESDQVKKGTLRILDKLKKLIF